MQAHRMEKAAIKLEHSNGKETITVHKTINYLAKIVLFPY